MNYADLDDVLARTGATGRAAELLGTFCGLFCMKPSTAVAQVEEIYLDLASDDDRAVHYCREAIRELTQHTIASLTDGLMTFEPMLPDDDESIEIRTQALADWCQGFLFGLSRGGLADVDAVSQDVRELIQDLAEISRAGVESSDDDEPAEQAYAELVEYVRVGVQVIFEEINTPNPTATKSSAQIH